MEQENGERSKSATFWCLGCTLKDWCRTIRTLFVIKDSLVCDFSYTCAIAFKPVVSFGKHFVVSLSVAEFLHVRLGLPMEKLGESFQKAFLEEWIHMGGDSPDEQDSANFPALVHCLVTKVTSPHQSCMKKTLPAHRPAGQPDALLWEHIGPQGTASFWERIEAPLLPLRPRCNFIHQKQLSLFPERLKLPFSNEEILSGFEDIDQFTAWVKADPHATCSKSHRRFSRSIRKEA